MLLPLWAEPAQAPFTPGEVAAPGEHPACWLWCRCGAGGVCLPLGETWRYPVLRGLSEGVPVSVQAVRGGPTGVDRCEWRKGRCWGCHAACV